MKTDSSGRGWKDTGHVSCPLVLFQWAVFLTAAVLIGLTVNQFRTNGIPLVGDWSPKGRLSGVGSGDGVLISLEEARELFENNEVLFLDARSAGDYEAGHIQGALSMPWGEFESRFEEIMTGIPTDYPIVAYCDGESCDLSKELALALLAKGYVNVRVLFDGWNLWRQASLPIGGS